jgi:hypothetical protein
MTDLAMFYMSGPCLWDFIPVKVVSMLLCNQEMT